MGNHEFDFAGQPWKPSWSDFGELGQEAQTGDAPPTVHLFRRPLLDEWIETGVPLDALITHVVVHEIGHHFGLSDIDMHVLEDMVAP